MTEKTREVTVDIASSRISRRESLQWLGAMLAANALTPYPADARDVATNAGSDNWPKPKLTPVAAAGYGQDPDLVALKTGPWPRTLTEAQLQTVRIIADILVPREGNIPSAAELHVEDVVDEWVSAPYERQTRDREMVIPFLQWIDEESERRFESAFAYAEADQQLEIVDDIAWLDAEEQFLRSAAAFDRLRSIVVAAFFCTPEGNTDLGYLGGTVIAGDYPGPSDKALRHLDEILASLALEPAKDPALDL